MMKVESIVDRTVKRLEDMIIKGKPRAEALTREHILKGMAAQEKVSKDHLRDDSTSTRSKEAAHAVTRG